MRYRRCNFRGQRARHNLKAQNLAIFSQIAEDIDEETRPLSPASRRLLAMVSRCRQAALSAGNGLGQPHRASRTCTPVRFNPHRRRDTGTVHQRPP
jgi:hypothetical protein